MNNKPTKITVRVRPFFARHEAKLMNAISIMLDPLHELSVHPLVGATVKTPAWPGSSTVAMIGGLI